MIFFDREAHRGFGLSSFSEAPRRTRHRGRGMNHKEAAQVEVRNDSKENNHEKNPLPRSSFYDPVQYINDDHAQENNVKRVG